MGYLAALEVFWFCEEDEGEGDEAVELVSYLNIALPICISFCCSVLFWYDGVTSWMAIAVAAVVLLLLYFTVIMVVMICFSSGGSTLSRWNNYAFYLRKRYCFHIMRLEKFHKFHFYIIVAIHRYFVWLCIFLLCKGVPVKSRVLGLLYWHLFLAQNTFLWWWWISGSVCGSSLGKYVV